jgi:hypothetical protein
VNGRQSLGEAGAAVVARRGHEAVISRQIELSRAA